MHARSWRWLVLSLLFVPLVSAPPDASSRTRVYDGRVIKVLDGDTLRVLHRSGQLRVTLAYIDAPDKYQADGQRAREILDELVAGEEVRVRVLREGKFKHLISEVYLEGDLINAQLVARGYAWIKPDVDAPESIRAALEEAKAAGRGIWQFGEPQPPWEWREEQGYDFER
jgi:endonuclease YncB( thermonuclease family)